MVLLTRRQRGTKLDPLFRRAAWSRPAEVVDVASGTIKRLVRDRGFGFIRDEGGQEWFFHRSSVEAGSFETLNEGQRVSFDEEPSQKGPRAGNIRAES
jgi:CspA family cold shock protein